jgi:acyl carrier protein
VADVKRTFRDLLEELVPALPAEFAEDTDLTQGILDSFAFVVIFEHIEDAVGRELRDDERGRSTVRSLAAIVDFIERESSLV